MKRGLTMNEKTAQGVATWTNANESDVRKDINEMNRQELAKELRPIAHKVNARIDRLENSQYFSPALKAINGNGGKIKIRGMNLNELRHEYARAQSFIQMQTSSVTGARQYNKEVDELLGGEYREEVRQKIFETFKKVQETYPPELQVYDSKQLIQDIADDVDEKIDDFSMSEDEIEERTEEILQARAEEIEQAYKEHIEELEKEFKDIGE